MSAQVAACEPCQPREFQMEQSCYKCPHPSTSTKPGSTGCYACSAGFYYSPFPVERPGEDPVRCDDATMLEAQCRDDPTACFDLGRNQRGTYASSSCSEATEAVPSAPRRRSRRRRGGGRVDAAEAVATTPRRRS